MIMGPNLTLETVDLGPKLPKPSRVECFVCKEPGEDLKRCGKCKMVSYCSRECQKRDWANHKAVCFKYMAQSVQKHNKKIDAAVTPEATPATPRMPPANIPQFQPPTRPVMTILDDMRRHCAVHHVLAFGPLVFDALDLFHDLARSETHFVALTMRRNLGSHDPFTLYSLLDAVVLPMSDIEPICMGGPDGMVWPLKQHKRQLKDARLDKSLTGLEAVIGAALVVCMELGANYPVNYYDSVEDALKQGSDGMTPVTIEITQLLVEMMKRSKKEPAWKISLRNAFDGHLYAVQKTDLPLDLKENALHILEMSDEAEADWQRAQMGKR
uniref:MYND-type domain-containing protein n=1 Tax=Mycena chlorophos TaxID=658473 RepID=A0ABQ0LFE8_MYCCL|nr:predicted protein [Mycena chlorophos]